MNGTIIKRRSKSESIIASSIKEIQDSATEALESSNGKLVDIVAKISIFNGGISLAKVDVNSSTKIK